jgi:hypothetical protein
VMVMQYCEGLTDREAADAVRTRIDWKYALSLEITDPGFDFSILSERECQLCSSNLVKKATCPPNEDEEVEQKRFAAIRQPATQLFQYRPMRIFLLMFACILLFAIIQSGLLGWLIVIIVISAILFRTRIPEAIDMLERWMGTPLHPLVRKLLVGNPSEALHPGLEQEQINIQQFPGIRTLDDLRILTPPAFEHLVGEVIRHRNYTEVQVVGKSRDLCVDITARGPHGELVAVQCKRYTTKKVSSDELQKFIGMIYVHHRADRGMYFTTSSYTKDAQKLGENNHIELIDGQGLIKIISDL